MLSRRARQLLISMGLAVLISVPSRSADFQPYQMDGLSVVVVSGEFRPDEDLGPFFAALQSNQASVVTFDSPGGEPYTAMRLGRAIWLRELYTIQVRKMDCASACALAFLGGVRRGAEPGSIGVHRTSFANPSSLSPEEAAEGVQSVTADILSYLREMDVDPAFLEFSLRYASNDMRYLSKTEMDALKVTTGLDGASNSSPTVADPPMAYAPPRPDTGQAATNARLETAAITFVRELLEQHVNDEGRALARVLTTYAETVNYYGKTTALSDVIADKQRYFTRWPERGYHIRNDSLMVTCANDNCMVSGVYDWVVRSIARSKQAKGAARFSYTISLGSEPRIIAETGEVLK